MALIFVKSIENFIKKKLPKNYGFAFIAFPFGENGSANYISNATKESMIEALRLTADNLEKEIKK